MTRAGKHDLTIRRFPSVTESDADGNAVVGTVTQTTVRASLDFMTASEVLKAQQMGVTARAVSRMPVGTAISYDDEVEAAVAGDGYPPMDANLVGIWLVSAIYATRTHTRVLLRRPEP